MPIHRLFDKINHIFDSCNHVFGDYSFYEDTEFEILISKEDLNVIVKHLVNSIKLFRSIWLVMHCSGQYPSRILRIHCIFAQI